MDTIRQLLQKLSSVEKLARASKWRRFATHPMKYTLAMIYREIIYRVVKKGIIVNTTSFLGKRMRVKLPSSMDIYLTGGKTDDSEIRLTKFIIKYLQKGNDFFDIGAHAGFYSLLATKLAGEEGRVVCAEPSPGMRKLLQKNLQDEKNIILIEAAILDHEGQTSFFELPVIYSEYNTTVAKQYAHEKWWNKARQINVKAVTGDQLIRDHQLNPAIIKIDVEGSENRVVEGLRHFLSHHHPWVVMEFVNEQRNNFNHRAAGSILQSMGYTALRIDTEGNPVVLEQSPADYIKSTGMSSDNIVYAKKELIVTA